MKMPARTIAWCVAALMAAAWGCDRPREGAVTDAASSGAAIDAPVPRAAVGPIPGPDVGPPGRANPYGNRRDAATEGRELFVQFNCSGCHGGRAGGGMGPSLRDVDWLYGAADAQVFSSIAEGRAHGMPAWGARLTEDQVWKLVAYVKSLRTPDEPHPPN